MKELIIIGARGFGREIYNCARECAEQGKYWTIKGYLDDKTDALTAFPNYPPIIDSVENYLPQQNDVFICALGDVGYKKKYIEIILNKGGKFTNIIHPTVIIGSNTKIGTGCIALARTSISCDCSIGNFVTIQPLAVIAHDVSVGDYCIINTFSFLAGFVNVAEEVTIYPHASVLPRLSIGRKASIGAGSVVIKNVKSETTVFGNPARTFLDVQAS